MGKNRTTKKCGPSRRLKKKSRTGKNSQKVPDPQEKLVDLFWDIGKRKGLSNQERFEQIFQYSFKRPYWFVGIRKATQYEDYNEGTDFFIVTKNYGEIRFDVKSSFWHYERQIKEQTKKRIFVWAIVVKPHMSDEEIRQSVFKKCEVHITRLKKAIRLGEFQTRAE